MTAESKLNGKAPGGSQGLIDINQTQAEVLDEEFKTLTADQRLQRAFELLGEGLTATTSFGRDSGLLLHHLYRLHIPIRVFFIDTTFHFKETLDYRDTLVSHYQTRLQEFRSTDPDNHRYAMEVANVIRIQDRDACCGINKVAVQARFLGQTDVKAFISGLRRDQAETRKETPFVQMQKGKLKICPFADWPQEDVDLYLKLWEVPEHPLAKEGYTSIGCSPGTCTTKPLNGDTRSGRWAGSDKIECGIHLDFNL